MEYEELSEEEKSVGGRRGSYSRACRKSQSLDHLYEQAIVESQSEGNSHISSKNESMVRSSLFMKAYNAKERFL